VHVGWWLFDRAVWNEHHGGEWTVREAWADRVVYGEAIDPRTGEGICSVVGPLAPRDDVDDVVETFLAPLLNARLDVVFGPRA
jgi:hypothetical protein